ncbi:MAG: 50S ribosomal protein L20 [Patescibacteria group bacterium]|jgi:large subunit ribosomal protein L20
MPRVKRGTIVKKRHKKLLALTKGFRHGRKSLFRRAKEAILKASQYSYRDRRNKKREFRNLWTIKINAAVREEGITYSEFINGLKLAKIELNRKVLSELAQNHKEEFVKITEKAKAALK